VRKGIRIAYGKGVPPDSFPGEAPQSPVAESELLDIIRAEYREMPCLRLTKPQIQRLWSLDQATCENVLRALESQHFLKRTDDRYVRAA
jgi:hypothetical protein